MVMVPEGRQVFSPLSVEDNLLVGGYTNRGRRKLDQIKAEVYELFPVLYERRDAPAGLLSGGEQEMLAFGRAMMSMPKLILMDEPSMGLAPIMVDRVMSALTAINARDTSILVVEQNAAAVLQVATYAYVLDQGRIVHSGPAEGSGREPNCRRVLPWPARPRRGRAATGRRRERGRAPTRIGRRGSHALTD